MGKKRVTTIYSCTIDYRMGLEYNVNNTVSADKEYHSVINLSIKWCGKIGINKTRRVYCSFYGNWKLALAAR